MKFFVSLLVVFMMVAFVASPVMACAHGDDDQDGGSCGSGHTGDTEMFEGGDDDSDGDHDNGDGCSGDSCNI